MNLLKRRISILLCFLMVFTTVFVAAPTETQAATETTSYYFYGPATSEELVVYNGAKNLYAGDYISVEKYTNKSGTSTYDYLGCLSTLSGVKYKSSKPAIAEINSKTGEITTKKQGTTTITVTYKNNTVTFDLTVLKSKTALINKLNDYYTYSDYKTTASAADKAGKAFLATTGSTLSITKNNRYELLTAYKNYTTVYSGYTYVHNYDSSTNTYTFTYYVYSPTATRAYAFYNKIANYSNDYNPFVYSTGTAKQLNVKSIKGSGKTVTITLKKAITADQIYGANYVFSWDSEVKSSKTYTFPIYVQDTKTGYKYYGIATMTQGSKTITIKLQNKSLTKGRTYKLLAQSRSSYQYSDMGGWLLDDANKNTFKATKQIFLKKECICTLFSLYFMLYLSIYMNHLHLYQDMIQE